MRRHGPLWGGPRWAASSNYRTVTTVTGVLRLRLTIRRGLTPACPPCQTPSRPEEEGRYALPTHECGLEVIALVGTLRYAQHRRVAELHQALRRRHVVRAPRTVLPLLERDAALVALSWADPARLQQSTPAHGRVILALAGLQPDVGQAILWVLRDGLSTAVLLARSLLSATQEALAALIHAGPHALAVPSVGVLSDGQHSIRRAVALAWPEVPHHWCHFHDLNAAAKPVYAADRRAKKALQQRVRGVRPIERQGDGRTPSESEVIRGDGGAVRRALTDEGRPPLVAAGLRRHDRLAAIAASCDRSAKRGASPTPSPV
jgi:hypothetical protein